MPPTLMLPGRLTRFGGSIGFDDGDLLGGDTYPLEGKIYSLLRVRCIVTTLFIAGYH